MDRLSAVGNVASIIGLIASLLAIYYAKSAAKAARDARVAIRRANAKDMMARIGETATQLQACLENDQQLEAVVRARDLISEISRYKLRYERFLDVISRERVDGSRDQISVISRTLASRGIPNTPQQKDRLLRICHHEVVAVLNEESARIIAAIEKEDE